MMSESITNKEIKGTINYQNKEEIRNKNIICKCKRKYPITSEKANM